MKIKSIQKQKNGKYKLKLEDNSTIMTYDTVILDNNLLFDQNLDAEKIAKITKENGYFDIYNQTLKYVSKKIRSEKEVKKFVEKFELDQKNVDDLIIRFKNNGIINDNNFVKAYIHDRMNFSNDGPFKIKEELLKHDIDNKIIDEEFSKIDNSIFEDKMNKIINKKIKSNTKYSNSILKRKINNELFLLGYSVNDIDSYFYNIDNKNIVEKEYNKLYKKYSLKLKNDELKNTLFQKLYAKGFNKEDIWSVLKNI